MSGLTLDTHVWIWMVEGIPRLDKRTIASIEQTVATAPVYVPSILLWEAAMLVSRSRVSLSLPIRDWFALALERSGFSLAPITADVALAAAGLSAAFPGDPADRLIAATAKVLDAPLVTGDRKILLSAEANGITIHSP
jgi:PIN domain nuclease of toxin-antitoxin system